MEPSNFWDDRRASLEGALVQAAKEIDTCIQRNSHFPDLAQSVLASSASDEYAFEDGLPKFGRKLVTMIPTTLLEQITYTKFKSFTGIFAEINRVWITIDNRLFLWNYKDQKDLVVYDGLDQLITSAGIAVPKSGIFTNEVKYLVVLATPVELVMLAVTFESSDIKLYPTKFAIPSDNVNMLKIVGTSTGRVFMVGNDGSLNEFVYQMEDGWFSRKCRKVNHSTSVFSSLLPNFLKLLKTEDPTVDLVVDEGRHILYTLSKNSIVTVYDLGACGTEMKKVASHSNVSREIRRSAPQQFNNVDDSAIAIIGMFPVLPSESKKVHLVCTTRGAHRLYFTTSSSNSSRPNALILLHVRFPPNMARSEVQSAHHVDNTLYPLQSLPTTETHLNYYSHGVFMYPSHSIEQYDVLVAVSSDANQIQQPAETRNFARLAQPSAFPAAFQERASSIELEGRICAITETPLSQLIPKSMLQLDLTDIGANELTAQHFFPPREFLCLTNSGLYVLTKMRPVDTLCDWLLAARGADTPELRQFFSLYGPDQACAMCLVLACSYYASPKHASDAAQDGGAGATAQGEQRQLNPSLLMSRRSAFSSDVSLAYQVRRDAQLTSYATMCFFGYGGRPTTRQDSDLNVFPSSPGVPVDHGRYHLYGGAVPANYGGASGLSGLVCFSASHDGFALYFSRILQPIWHANLFHASEDGIKCQLQGEPIAQIRAMLYRLKQFLQANPQFAKLRSDCAAPRSREDSPRTPGQRFSQKSNLASTPLYARSPTSNRDPHPVHYHASDGTPEEEPEQLERLSLSNLHHLLLRSIEALEFLDLIADTDILRMNLSMTTKTRILSIKFRDFVISTDSDILRELTNCLNMDYSSQFQDPTVMDKLTTLLRERCPSYFSNVDRIRLQACDLLCRTKSPTITIEERQALLRQSLQQFKQIAKELRPILKQICREYQLLRDYGCVIDLALTCAQQLDPNQNGLTWFKRTKKTAETEQSAYEERMNCYTIITELLDELHSDASPQPTSKTEEPLTEQPLYPPQESTPVTSSPFGNSKHKTSTLFAPQPKFPPPNPASPPSPAQHRASTPPPTDPDSVASPESDSHRVLVHTLRLCTQSNDELWHYVLYQWYIDRNLATDLIRLSTPYLEDYLQHICQPASIRLHLLWQYFLRNDKLLKAAVILMQLADQQDDNQTLSNRLEHLTQAQFLIMAHPEADHRLAEEIQEKVEVARIQFKVYNELQILSDTNLRDQVRAQLDERLYNLSDLFNKFVNKFGLFESALSILHDSGYQDDRLVKRIWNNIIQEEISKSAQLDYSLASLSAKLHSLIQLYYPSQYVFPMDHIVGILEQHSFEVIRTHSSDFYPNWILDTFLRSGVPFIVMFRLYYEFYESRSSYWQGPHQQLHLLRILYHLLFTWKESFGAPSALHDSTLSLQSEYRLLHSKYVNSAIGKFLVTLDSISKLSDPDSASITSAANEVAELFKELKQKIN